MTLKFIWNVREINIHLRFNWDLNLIEVCTTQSWYITSTGCSYALCLLSDYAFRASKLKTFGNPKHPYLMTIKTRSWLKNNQNTSSLMTKQIINNKNHQFKSIKDVSAEELCCFTVNIWTVLHVRTEYITIKLN